jgi:hypothetical protein
MNVPSEHPLYARVPRRIAVNELFSRQVMMAKELTGSVYENPRALPQNGPKRRGADSTVQGHVLIFR